MSETELKCTSCNRKITSKSGLARFKCPSCLKYEIIRCRECREKATKYICPNCNFDGPN
ncbi:RNA-binding protein [Candidatus Woesearchaeota archaeon]|nr:RNA-binding protein [Candidatus Woesearchaeota archaeon]